MITFSEAYEKACEESQEALLVGTIFTLFVVPAVWLVADTTRA